jgi:hypothetical protein
MKRPVTFDFATLTLKELKDTQYMFAALSVRDDPGEDDDAPLEPWETDTLPEEWIEPAPGESDMPAPTTPAEFLAFVAITLGHEREAREAGPRSLQGFDLDLSKLDAGALDRCVIRLLVVRDHHRGTVADFANTVLIVLCAERRERAKPKITDEQAINALMYPARWMGDDGSLPTLTVYVQRPPDDDVENAAGNE